MGKLCQYCSKREAKIHFTEIKDGKQTEMHICEQCAHEKNVAMAFPSLLSHIVKGASGLFQGSESDAVPAACPDCGLTYTAFKSRGRLGCPTCYEAFAPVLIPLLEKVHGASRHAGEAPVRLAAEIESRREGKECDALQSQLDEAIRAEQYEQAAMLRDKIRAFKRSAKRET